MITSWDTIGALSFLLRRTMDEKWLKSKHSCGRWFFWIDFTWMHVPSSILPLSTFWKLIFGVKHGYHTHTHMCREFFTSSFYQFWSLCEQCFLWIFFGVPTHWTMFRHGKWLFSTNIRYLGRSIVNHQYYALKPHHVDVCITMISVSSCLVRVLYRFIKFKNDHVITSHKDTFSTRILHPYTPLTTKNNLLSPPFSPFS